MDDKYEEGLYVVMAANGCTEISKHYKGWWDAMGWDAGLHVKEVICGPFTAQDVINWQFEHDSPSAEAIK